MPLQLIQFKIPMTRFVCRDNPEEPYEAELWVNPETVQTVRTYNIRNGTLGTGFKYQQGVSINLIGTDASVDLKNAYTLSQVISSLTYDTEAP